MFLSNTYADTNVFPVLNCKNRAYTNATIESVTPATVTIFWDEDRLAQPADRNGSD